MPNTVVNHTIFLRNSIKYAGVDVLQVVETLNTWTTINFLKSWKYSVLIVIYCDILCKYLEFDFVSTCLQVVEH